MNRRRVLQLLLGVGLVLVVFGYVNTRPVALGKDHWRVKNSQRCDGSLTKELRTGQIDSYFSWLLDKCTGKDRVTYYAYDALIAGGLLSLGSAILWFKQKKY